jgi:hypothetical protein
VQRSKLSKVLKTHRSRHDITSEQLPARGGPKSVSHLHRPPHAPPPGPHVTSWRPKPPGRTRFEKREPARSEHRRRGAQPGGICAYVTQRKPARGRVWVRRENLYIQKPQKWATTCPLLQVHLLTGDLPG